MNKLLGSLLVGLIAGSAIAQSCPSSFLGTSLGAGGDVVFGIQPIGFAFPLAGVTYSDVHICDKGYVYLSNAGVPAPGGADFSATAAEFASGPPRLAALWSDIQVLLGNNGEVFINSTPTLCTITWKNAQIYNSGAAGGPVFDMQMQLSPTGQVQCFYGPGTTNNSIATQPTWQVGIAGISPGGVTLPAASDLSAGGSTTNNLLYEEWTAPGTFDMANNSLLNLPTSPGWTFLTLGAPANCASTVNYGAGCLGGYDSVYEAQPMTNFDLANTTISWLRNAQGYVVLNTIPGAIVPVGPGAQTVAAGVLDGEQQFTLSAPMPAPGGPTNVLNVTTKGYIELGGTSGLPIDFSPTASELLANPRSVFACWHDYNQSAVGSGLITFEEAGGVAYVTWNGVYSFGTTAPNTVQFQFEIASGNVRLVIGAVAGAASATDIVVGSSVAGNSVDPGATDLSSNFGVVTVLDTAILPLALTANGSPALGNASFALVTSNVPNLVPLAFVFVGTVVVNPGLDLSFIGMPGCFGYTNANLASATFSVSPMTGSGSQALPIPNVPGLVGTQLSCQSVAFSLATPLNLIASNGTSLTIGY